MLGGTMHLDGYSQHEAVAPYVTAPRCSSVSTADAASTLWCSRGHVRSAPTSSAATCRRCVATGVHPRCVARRAFLTSVGA